MDIRCWFLGHRKKYVGVQDLLDKTEIYPKYCIHQCQFIRHCDFCWNVLQIARWVCERCSVMGEKSIRRGDGLFMAYFGKLVPDEKKWANFKTEAW